jgi:methionyl-tRNA formyltransferase
MALERPLSIVFAGSPQFAVPTLEALQASAHRLVGVYCQPDRPAGRGLKIRACAVKQCALGHAVSVFQPNSLRGVEAQSTLASLQPDLLVVVAYGLLLPPAVLSIPKHGCLNVHASLLPRWRGAAPIHRAILAGDETSGVSLMRLDTGLDTGPVYLQTRLSIDRETTAGQLHDRLSVVGAKSLIENLNAIVDGQIPALPQPDEGASYAPKIAKEEAAISWQATAHQLERQVRAFNPWPGAETQTGGQRLKIWRAHALVDDSGQPPGSVIAEGRDGIVVACGQGCLQITRLQLAGRRALDAAAFGNAQRLKGTLLG